MGFPVMTMTDTAAQRVKAIVENSGTDAKGVRVGIKEGRLRGMEYTIDLVTEPNATDDLDRTRRCKGLGRAFGRALSSRYEMGFEMTHPASGFTFTIRTRRRPVAAASRWN